MTAPFYRFGKQGFVYYLNHNEVKAKDQPTFTVRLSIAAPQCLISQLRGARERLAKQDARARTRSSSGAFACECAEQLTESRKLCTAAWRCRGVQGDSPCFAFLLQAFSFSNKKKMPKRGKCISFDYCGAQR